MRLLQAFHLSLIATTTSLGLAATGMELAALAPWGSASASETKTPASVHREAIKKVHGSIEVGEGQTAGAVKTVNGSITIGDHADVLEVKVVNGRIDIGNGARVGGDVKNVNGAIRVGQDARLSGRLANVNGGVSLSSGSRLDGELANVNGRIRLRGAQVASLTTTNGDIEITDGSIVHGDVIVREEGGGFGLDFFGSEPPGVTLGPDSEIRGQLILEREVELEVADSAVVGEITGVEPVRR